MHAKAGTSHKLGEEVSRGQWRCRCAANEEDWSRRGREGGEIEETATTVTERKWLEKWPAGRSMRADDDDGGESEEDERRRKRGGEEEEEEEEEEEVVVVMRWRGGSGDGRRPSMYVVMPGDDKLPVFKGAVCKFDNGYFYWYRRTVMMKAAWRRRRRRKVEKRPEAAGRVQASFCDTRYARGTWAILLAVFLQALRAAANVRISVNYGVYSAICLLSFSPFPFFLFFSLAAPARQRAVGRE